MHSHTIAILFSSVTLFAAPTWQAEREAAIRQHTAGNYREAERLFRSALADLHRAQDKLADALPLARRAVKMLEEAGEDATPRLAFGLQTLGAIERAAGRLAEAETLYRRALSISIAQNGENHPATATAKSN